MDLPRESKPLRGWRIDGKVRKTNDRSPKYQKNHQKLGLNAQRWWHVISMSFRGKGHSRIIYRNIFSSAHYLLAIKGLKLGKVACYINYLCVIEVQIFFFSETDNSKMYGILHTYL